MRQLLRHDQPVVPDQGSTRGSDALLAIGSQGKFRDARVSAVERPLGLAVTDDEDSRGGHGRGLQREVSPIGGSVCKSASAIRHSFVGSHLQLRRVPLSLGS